MSKLSLYIDKINLASQSPARLGILREEGLEVGVFPTYCNEDHNLEKPEDVVKELSKRKLESFMLSDNFTADIPSLACDTLLWFENMLIGKAHSEDMAYEQIRMLSGKTHRVYTGYALFIDGKLYNGFDFADVTFKQISPKALQLYIASGEWKGAAGSYHVDGLASKFIARVQGDISTVKGLPLLVVSDIIKTLR